MTWCHCLRFVYSSRHKSVNETKFENNFIFRPFQVHKLSHKASLKKLQRISKTIASNHNVIQLSFKNKTKRKTLTYSNIYLVEGLEFKEKYEVEVIYNNNNNRTYQH